MHLYFDENKALNIVPDDSIEAYSLHYFEKELEEHGTKMIVIHDSVEMDNPKPRKEK